MSSFSSSRLSAAGGSVTGVLLVGGSSSRFGSPKTLARLPSGETLAERAWSLLDWCDERIALGKDGPQEELPFPVVGDGRPLVAPIVGVAAGLRLARHDLCVFVPVDMPLLERRDLIALAAACVDAAVSPTGPLPGAYRRGALAVLRDGIASGRLSLRDAIARMDVAEVVLEPARLANVNTRGDLDALTRALERAPRRG